MTRVNVRGIRRVTPATLAIVVAVAWVIRPALKVPASDWDVGAARVAIALAVEAAQLLLGLILAVLCILFSLWLFDRLTTRLEEWAELKAGVESGCKEDVEQEFGDVLFVLVNLSRFLDIDPERSLGGAIEKFVRRFQYIEAKVAESGRKMEEVSLEEMDRYWDEAKDKGM